MAFDTEFKDENGRTVATFWTGTERSYVLPDGSRCTVPQAAAWCRDCKEYVAAEEVPSVEYIDGRLAALRAGPQAFGAWAEAGGEGVPEYVLKQGWDRYRDWAVKHWEMVRTWRLLRRSPARCLQCFSTEIEALPRGIRETHHPVTGKRLTLHVGTRTSTTQQWEYSPEGLPFEGPEAV